MSTGLLDIIKRASLDAADNAQLCDLRFGTVVSIDPLKVQVTSQFILPQSLLIVPQNLMDYSVNATMSWTSDDGETTFSGIKTITIHNGLRIGERVALLRKQGGQSYFILDRVSDYVPSAPVVASDSTYDFYSGTYTIVPTVESQTMDTENKVMKSDVTITEIPYSEMSNDANGTTVTIA